MFKLFAFKVSEPTRVIDMPGKYEPKNQLWMSAEGALASSQCPCTTPCGSCITGGVWTNNVCTCCCTTDPGGTPDSNADGQHVDFTDH